MKYDSEKIGGVIGMRVVKTVLSVYLCLLYGILMNTSPNYAAVAALISMQNDHLQGLNQGKRRITGTLIGGVFGLIAIVLIKFFNLKVYGHIHYLLISLFLIPIIYINVNLFSTASTTISCVVYLGIAISHVTDVSPLIFTIKRTFDTSIGVLISVYVNKYLWPVKKVDEEESKE